MEWTYSEDRKQIILNEPPKRFKYITGTRLASILGLNEYSSPFQTWCECTRLVIPPFEETIYTKFGKINECKQREYISKTFPNVVGPEEYFGDFYETVRWNFFDEKHKPFAGLWDAVCTKNNGKDITAVIEFKTASNAVKWDRGAIPISYELQGALYAKLLGLDRVIFVVSFPEKLDYVHPEDFKVTDDNTKVLIRKLDEMFFEIDGEYLTIDGCLEKAKEIWDKYIKTGISPQFDEVKDKEYLDIIRKSKPTNDNSLFDLTIEAIKLAKQIKEKEETSGIKQDKQDLKVLESAIKEKMIEDNLDCVGNYTLKRTEKIVLNDKKLAKEHEKLYNSYCETKVSYTLSKSVKEGED